MSPEIIPIRDRLINSEAVPTADAKELHIFLGVKARFNDWILRRIQQYGFVQDVDYLLYSDLSKGTTPSKEYFVTPGMAKELCMAGGA